MKIAIISAGLVLALPGLAAAEPIRAVFTDIHYQDANRPAATAKLYRNPVLPGYYPDPSIERVGDDYYLINSTFAYYPGIPVFHSKDLVHWKQITNAIDRPGMLDFSGLSTSRGVFAPDLSYHAGVYYILNTCVDCKGNFVITAKDPKGPWSDPVWLPFGGIDPSLFWDDDGQAYIVYNDAPMGQPLYSGHRALWLQGFDPATMTLKGPRQIIVNGGVDLAKKPVWIEGPHIYKKDGHYYLMAAEGGTAENHSEVVFRSDTAWGPYIPYTDNPILTQRDLPPGRTSPITSSGHADLIETPAGEWHAVFLATRPYKDNLYNTGRETFMLPVAWPKDAQGVAWPVILAHGASIPAEVALPKLLPKLLPELPSTPTGRDHDGYDPLSWLQVRTPKTPFLTRTARGVTLAALAEAFGDVTSHPALTGHRLQHASASFSTRLDYAPRSEGDRAGIIALQNDHFYLFFGLARTGGETVLEITRRSGAEAPRDGVVLAAIPAPKGPVKLRIMINGDKAGFTYSFKNKVKTLAENIDVSALSTARAGGFVGTIIGLYAYGQKP